MTRHDYRRAYRDMTLEQLYNVLKVLIDSMLDAIATNDSTRFADSNKRISYVQSRIRKLQPK